MPNTPPTDTIPFDDTAFEHLYELYHKNLPPLLSDAMLAPKSTTTQSSASTKEYRRAERVPLASPETSALSAAIAQRASYTDATERRPITDSELATLLTYAYGPIRDAAGGTNAGDSRRPVASAGACYPLELYPIVLDSPDIESGIYHYAGHEDVLEQLDAGDYSEWLREHWTWITDEAVAAAIVITARLGYSADRYGEMAYLFAAIEAGAVIQTLQLLATELGIGSRPHNGLDYPGINEQLQLPSDEYLLSTVVFAGQPPGDSG
ncbi:SagB/ThcOx family dehydrogenase [Halonotius roseus]|uniref:SagB/ThcOx family dehydrogenase n=1 Tax=Halonotius roseus TaxID=2511997 RepID=A0A544QL33_9EURY|nr:SagB/ThcOx family dehydrogenase [Halonotius roseus]TQQ79037.1 SagB/ThcOx family dehydrogenase [Halonotius roseus]